MKTIISLIVLSLVSLTACELNTTTPVTKTTSNTVSTPVASCLEIGEINIDIWNLQYKRKDCAWSNSGTIAPYQWVYLDKHMRFMTVEVVIQIHRGAPYNDDFADYMTWINSTTLKIPDWIMALPNLSYVTSVQLRGTIHFLDGTDMPIDSTYYK